MTPDATLNAVTQPTPMLQWVLERDVNAITCLVDAFGDGSYELCVLPHWDPSAACIERFDAPTPALLRHAEVARRLREDGWLVVDHADAGRVHAAA